MPIVHTSCQRLPVVLIHDRKTTIHSKATLISDDWRMDWFLEQGQGDEPVRQREFGSASYDLTRFYDFNTTALFYSYDYTHR